MGVFNVATGIKKLAMSIPMCSMASFGDISLFNNKATIAYPFVNIDVISNLVVNNSLNTYTLRMYACDRNPEVYIAYNKAELVLDSLMMRLDIQNYTTNYFSLDFKDVVNGVYTDIKFDSILLLNCAKYYDGFLLQEEAQWYILTEEDDYIEINN